TRAVAARFDSGRQYRVDEGGGPLSVPPGVPVLDVCDLVDSSGGRPGDCGLRADDSAAVACHRVVEQGRAGAAGAAGVESARSVGPGAGGTAGDAGGKSAAAARCGEAA